MERNIRTAYYNQLGLSSQKLKSTLDELFKGRIIDFKKIKQICKDFTIPAQYRPLLWKIVLLNTKYKVIILKI